MRLEWCRSLRAQFAIGLRAALALLQMCATERVSTDVLMDGVRERVRQRVAPSVGSFDLEAVERLQAAVGRRQVLLSELTGLGTDPALNTVIRFESHRKWAPVINFVKRRILFPLNFWLFQFCSNNFERQHQLNREMLASIELLAIENAALKRQLASLTGGAAGSLSSTVEGGR